MFEAIILLSFVAVAFWREAIKLALAAFVAVLVLGVVQLVQIADDAGVVDVETRSITEQR